MTGVTHLAGAGVAVLHELIGRPGPGLLLLRLPGSLADQIMILTALPRTSTDCRPQQPDGDEPVRSG